MDQNIKQQIVETLNGTTNVLVTVSSDPTVDELAACLGLTLVLNKLGKHATAVFSGKVPSTLEFLKPDETLEDNTNSLRDFIISLDKSKADKLRYKVEDEVVKIFITPYKTSISEKDLDFSQGDFNVDVVLALGVHKREELDKAIVAHGRILHDATVICVNHDQVSNLGVYNWQDAEASSLCEMVVDLSETIQPDNFDAQTATALLTGIVAETERFSNAKTTPRTMSLSAKLMAAGANQQLVASKLQTKLDTTQVAMPKEAVEDAEEEGDGGTLRIEHEKTEGEEEPEETGELEESLGEDVTEEPLQKPLEPKPEKRIEPLGRPLENPVEEPEAPEPQSPISDVRADTGDGLAGHGQADSRPMPIVDPTKSANSKIAYEPPMMGGTLTANARPEDLEPTTDSLSLPSPVNQPILNHTPPKVVQVDEPIIDKETVSHIEESVGSDHVAQENTQTASQPDLSALSEAVNAAAEEGQDNSLEPLVASGSTPLDMNVQDHAAPPPPPLPSEPPADPTIPLPAVPPVVPETPLAPPQAPSTGVPSAMDVMSSVAQTDQPLATSLPNQVVPPDPGLPPEQTASSTSQPLGPPPPVPPPMPFTPPTPATPGQQPPLPPTPGQ